MKTMGGDSAADGCERGGGGVRQRGDNLGKAASPILKDLRAGKRSRYSEGHARHGAALKSRDEVLRGRGWEGQKDGELESREKNAACDAA